MNGASGGAIGGGILVAGGTLDLGNDTVALNVVTDPPGSGYSGGGVARPGPAA